MKRAALKILGITTIVLGIGAVLSAPVEAKRYRLMCQGDHLHFGSSTGFPSRAKAMRAAVRDWAGFTAFEYGNHFAHWKLSKNKRANCTKSGRSWNCSISSTPCRRSRGR